ncbi:hypothetical protein ACHQM5_000066 [Ranunculus cassubicifolius]
MGSSSSIRSLLSSSSASSCLIHRVRSSLLSTLATNNGSLRSSSATLATNNGGNSSSATLARNNGGSHRFIWKPQRVSCMWEEYQRSKEKSQCREFDGNHWLFILSHNDGLQFESERQLFNYYLNYLTPFLGSKEEAKKRIYLTSCGWCYGFGAEIDENIVKNIQDSRICSGAREDPYYSDRKNDLSVESGSRFNPLNRNRQLDNMFSYHQLSQRSLNWNHDHWLIHMKKPEGSQKEMTYYCVEMLAKLVGSEEAARDKIYVMWLKFPFGFGAAIDEETMTKLKGFPDVLTVIPDYAFDTKVQHQRALNILPSVCGIRFSNYYPTNATSKNWLFDMEEYADDSGDSIYSPLMFSRYSGSFYRVEGGSGCKNWFITMEKTSGEFTSLRRRITSCIKTLATAIGRSTSHQDMKRKIYRIKCGCDFIGFGIKIDDDASNKLKGHPGITVVLDEHFDEARTEASADRTAPRFAPLNRNARLNDIFCYHNLSERNPEWNHDHWLIHVKPQRSRPSSERKTLELCIQLLAEVLGSEEDAKRKIYIVWSNTISGFGAEIDKATSERLKDRSDVLTVLPDFAFDVKNKASGGVLVVSPTTRLGPYSENIFYRSLFDDSTDSDDN